MKKYVKNVIITKQILTGSVVNPDDLYVLDPDHLVRGTDPERNPSILKQKL
jgi:hypothetical protein